MARSISCSQARRLACSLGRKIHSDAVLAGVAGGRHLVWPFLRGKTASGNLDQDASAVAHQFVSPHGTSVLEVFENLQALLNNSMALLAFYVGDETDTTGIVFIGRVV
jgi:hypothetical protein